MTHKTQQSGTESDSLTAKELNEKLKKLKTEKGIVSRKIGDAKKISGPFQHLLDEMKVFSLKIQDIQKSLKDISKSQIGVDDCVKEVLLPSQFKPRYSREDKQVLTTKLCTDMGQWDDYVSKHENASAYHSSAIKLVIEKTFGHYCPYLITEDENGVTRGVLPLTELKSKLFGHYFISLPFFNYGGVIADSDEAKASLLSAAENLTHNTTISHIEYRHTYIDKTMQTRSDKITMLLQLPETKHLLWERLGSKLRAQIKKPEKAGALTKIGREELIDDFYKVFSCNMRDLGTPVYSKLLFVNMLKYNPKANLVLVYMNSKPVSAGFILGWRDTLEIPWASTLRYANKYSVNMMLYWTILQIAIDQGYKIFDFGRSSKDSNTYRFKKQWGAQEQKLYWHYWLPDDQPLPQINPNNPKYKLLINMWKKLPVSLANIIGPHLVKNLP